MEATDFASPDLVVSIIAQPHPERAKTEGGGAGAKKREIPQIAREVVASLLSRATGPINPSFIKETIVRKEPDFDEREFGFSTFSRMLEAMEKEGLCQRIQQGRQWYVVSKEGGGKSGATREVPAEPSEDGADELPPEEAEEHIPDPEE